MASQLSDTVPEGLFSLTELTVFLVCAVAGLAVAFNSELGVGVLVFSIGVIVLHTRMMTFWNRHLQENNVAVMSVPLGTLLGALLLGVGTFLTLRRFVLQSEVLLAASMALFITLGYLYILLGILMTKGVKNSLYVEKDPYTGELCAYPSEKNYVQRVEDVAQSNRADNR